MPFARKRNALQFTEAELRKLESIRRSRTEEKRRTVRAAVLLDSLSGQSDEAIAQRLHTSRSTVVLCIQKCLQFGLEAGLGELPRTGKPRQLPDDAIAWVQNCACQKPKELGYSYELWTYKLLTAHVHRLLPRVRAWLTMYLQAEQPAQQVSESSGLPLRTQAPLMARVF